MKTLDLNFEVCISDAHEVAYNKAIENHDLVALKRILLATCDPADRQAIEQILPKELVHPI